MMRRPSTLVRAIRSMTAIITLWCLGCSGFEPLLEAALGAESTVMSCGSDGGATGSATVTPTDGTTHHAAVSAAADSRQAFDCGCGSCHAASPSTFALPSAPHVAPTTAFTRIIALVSVVRTPLLPPPQRAA